MPLTTSIFWQSEQQTNGSVDRSVRGHIPDNLADCGLQPTSSSPFELRDVESVCYVVENCVIQVALKTNSAQEKGCNGQTSHR